MARVVRESERVKPGDPTSIGPLRVLRRLGQGGMGAVFLVEDPRTGAQRALKTLRAGADLEGRRRFAREAEAMARVDDHPGVLRIHGAGEHEGAPYLIMAYAPGGDLAGRLAAGPLPPAEVAHLGVQLARGLAHLHARGVLHRDLKPSNVLFDEHGAPRLVDFGLAKLVGDERLTQSGTVLGTPAYMAPEQADGRTDLDARADVYGLGALLYHALTGRPPFQGPSVWAVIDRVLREPPTPPGQLIARVPTALEAVLLRALAKSRDDRFPSAEDMARALETLGREVGPGSPPLRRARLVVVVAGLTLAFGLALLAAPWRAPASPRSTDEPPAATPTPLTRSELADVTRAMTAALRAGRFGAVMDLASKHPLAGGDDDAAAIVAAAADPERRGVPAEWRSAVARADQHVERSRARFGHLARRLLSELETEGQSPRLTEALQVAGELRSTHAGAQGALRPFVTRDALDLQGAVADRVPLLLKATSPLFGLATRRDRQRQAFELLQLLIELEPESSSSLALRVIGRNPSIVGSGALAGSWEDLEQLVARAPELEARWPELTRVVPALWLAATPAPVLGRRWSEVERRWHQVVEAFPAVFDRGRLRSVGDPESKLDDAARQRAQAALWRAWDVRGSPEEERAAVVREGLAACEVFAGIDPPGFALHAARLHLLAGEADAASAVLDEVRVWPTAGMEYLALRQRVDVELLRGRLDLASKLSESEDGSDPSSSWCGRAVCLAALGQHDRARSALEKAEAAERDVGPSCPWWTTAETGAVLDAMRERDWSPVRAGRLFVVEQR